MPPPDIAPVKIVFLDAGTLWPDTRLRAPSVAHEMVIWNQTQVTEAVARVADADIVITNKVRITRRLLAAAPRLRLVAVAATGYDVVDIGACRAHSVAVCNVRDYATTTVPEHVFALILGLRRSLWAYRDAVIAGRWRQSGQFCFFDYPIKDLAGSTLGLVGAGALGGRVAELGRAFGMEVLLASRKGEPAREGRVSFDEVMARSDVISLHCPLRPETQGMIGEAEFAAMTRRPLLINTARGGLVDELALVRALDEGLISGAGFDVASSEPPDLDHPLIKLAGRPNVILTPHVAWGSQQAVQALADQVITNIEAFLAGRAVNRVA